MVGSRHFHFLFIYCGFPPLAIWYIFLEKYFVLIFLTILRVFLVVMTYQILSPAQNTQNIVLHSKKIYILFSPYLLSHFHCKLTWIRNMTKMDWDQRGKNGTPPPPSLSFVILLFQPSPPPPQSHPPQNLKICFPLPFSSYTNNINH
jgi:hypothetical protein